MSLPGRANSNTEFVSELMEYSNGGPLTQLFIVEAIRRYAEQVEGAGPECLPKGGFINSEAWYRCAKEITEEMDKFYSRERRTLRAPA
jgi:hypothetical protein